MDKDSIIEKIRALRNLAQNKAATVEEAATAARLAELLIQKHAFAEADLEGAAPEGIVNDDNCLTDWGERQNVWQNILISALGKAYNCGIVFKHNKSGSPGLYAIGRPSDVELLRYQFAFFVVELTRLAHHLAPSTLKRGEGKRWHNSFYRGGVNAITESLKAVKQEARGQATSSALAVVDKHMNAIEALKSKLYPSSREVKMGGSVDPDAYRLGKQAGAGLESKPALPPNVRGLLK
jgi:hypothetical protein